MVHVLSIKKRQICSLNVVIYFLKCVNLNILMYNVVLNMRFEVSACCELRLLTGSIYNQNVYVFNVHDFLMLPHCCYAPLIVYKI